MKRLQPLIWILILAMFLTVLGGCMRAEDQDDGYSDSGFSDLGGNVGDDDDDDDDDNDDDDDTSPEDCPGGGELSYILSPGVRNVPYPSNIFTTQDASSPTGIRPNLRGQVTLFLDDLKDTLYFLLRSTNKLDGFGVSSPIWFPATKKPNLSLAQSSETPGPDDAIFCTVLAEEDDPNYGAFWPIETTWDEAHEVIRVSPVLPFPEHTTLACVITDKLLTADNNCYVRPSHLEYVVSIEADPTHPQAEFLEPYRQELAPVVNALMAQCRMTTDEILGFTVFSTMWTTHELRGMRDKLETLADETPPVTGDWTKISDGGANQDAIWETTYDTISFRNSNGKFDYDEEGVPEPVGPEQVVLRVSMPADGIEGYEQPYPVVIHGHGINSSKNTVSSFGNFYGEYGFAMVGIDWVWHGDRSYDLPSGPLEEIIRFLRIYPILQPDVLRPNIKQDVADIIYLKHVVRNLATLDVLPYATNGDGIPDLDVDNIYYMGESLGSIHGGIVAAMEPDINTYLLYTAAANYKSLVLGAWYGEMVMDILELLESQFDFSIVEDIGFFFDLMMPLIESADPYTYGRYIFDQPLYPDRPDTINILQQMAADDNTLGGPASAQMARCIGLTQMIPYAWHIPGLLTANTPFEGPAVYQYDTESHGFIWQSDEMGLAARRQGGLFLRSALDEGTATVVDPFEE